MARPKMHDHDIYPIVIELRNKREQQGLTQKQVAERLGNSSAESVSNHERGQYVPNLALLDAWAAALGYDLYFYLEAKE